MYIMHSSDTCTVPPCTNGWCQYLCRDIFGCTTLDCAFASLEASVGASHPYVEGQYVAAWSLAVEGILATYIRRLARLISVMHPLGCADPQLRSFVSSLNSKSIAGALYR